MKFDGMSLRIERSLPAKYREPLGSSFSRTLARWGKVARGEDLTIGDFSKFEGGGVIAERASATEDKWTVYTQENPKDIGIAPIDPLIEAFTGFGPALVPDIKAGGLSAKAAARKILELADQEILQAEGKGKNHVSNILALLAKSEGAKAENRTAAKKRNGLG